MPYSRFILLLDFSPARLGPAGLISGSPHLSEAISAHSAAASILAASELL